MMTIKVYRAGAPEAPLREYAVEGLEEIPATSAYPPMPMSARGVPRAARPGLRY
ncbi:hypothetical protein [Streptomyces sp. NPDC127103]|uniref:hypothetical protein n=1 Tax=Streptomyces sp. NPDC127103 TaxID=3347139 RepID=UPI003654E2E3